jgi:UDP-glucose 4-epimerase
LLDACPTTTRFFFASTTEVYGDASGAASEERAVSPVSPYSYGKASAEMLIKLYRKLRGGDYTIFRIYNFFGDGLPPQHFISQLLDALEKKQPFPMTAGQQRRDIVSVEFVAQALYTALLSDNITNQTLNICRGISIPLQELASHIAEHYGARNLLQLGALPYRDNEVWDSHGDPEKLFALLGLRASPDWRSEVSQWLASRSSGKTA